MQGINSSTGKALAGIEHLSQSIRDILTTPVGSRVMRRNYGSNLFLLTDAPINQGTLVEIYAATAGAIKAWEPRFSLETVETNKVTEGSLEITITGTYLPDGKAIKLEGIVV